MGTARDIVYLPEVAVLHFLPDYAFALTALANLIR